MSTSKLAEPLKMCKKPSNCRINSEEELGVFEAAKYFSDVHAASQYNNAPNLTQKMMLNERQPRRAQRISLDMHNLKNSHTLVIEKPTTKEKKYKQPSSPGGKLTSFLNSLFNQTHSKKKKSLRDGDENNPVVRRIRRSSISHVWTTRSNHTNSSDANSSSVYQSSTSGFRTPPPTYSYGTNKSHQEPQGSMNYQKVLTLNKTDDKKQGNSERKNAWLSKGYLEKFKSSSSKFPEKSKNTFGDKYIPGEKKELKNFNEDNYDSDSSSDLFELKNYELNCYSSSGLPVYETSNMDGIKKDAPLYRG